MIIRRSQFRLTFLLFVFWYTPSIWGADNTITSITVVNNSNPGSTGLVIGDSVTYTVNYQGNDSFVSYSQYFRCTNCSPQVGETTWLVNSSSLGISNNESMLGDFQVRVALVFQRGQLGGGGQNTVGKTIDVGIFPPDDVEMVNSTDVLGVNLPVVYQPPPVTAVVFQMKRGERRLYYISGVVVEDIQRTPYGYAPDRSWFVGEYLQVNSGAAQILDYKGVLYSSTYGLLPTNYVVDKFAQKLGIRLANGCGGTTEVHFPKTFYFQQVKIINN